MGIWNEAEHARFKGKFASMGLNRQKLASAHHVSIGPQFARSSVVFHHEKGRLGVVTNEMGGGFQAHAMNMGSLKPLGNEKFGSRVEAAAALAEHHGVLGDKISKREKAANGGGVRPAIAHADDRRKEQAARNAIFDRRRKK